MKDEIVILRISKAEKERLKSLAESSGMKISRYLRELIGEEKVVPKLDENQFKTLKQIYWNMGKVGTNINQIAYNFNARLAPSVETKENDYSLLKSGERDALNIHLEEFRRELSEVRKEVANFTRMAS
jgi:hypothetical protein